MPSKEIKNDQQKSKHYKKMEEKNLAEFTVTSQTVATKAEELDKLNKDMLARASELTALVNSLDSIWEGDAHDAFKTEYEKSKNALANYSAMIAKYSASLSEIASEYAKTEASNVQIAQS